MLCPTLGFTPERWRCASYKGSRHR